MKKESLKEIFKKAADIASEVPETMQPTAFSRAVDILLGEVPVSTKAIVKKAKSFRKQKEKKEDVSIEQILQKLDRTKYPVINELDNPLDRSLFILKIAKDEFDIDGLTPPQIAKILTEKFRIKTLRRNVYSYLSKATKVVDSISAGKAHKYRIMQPGEVYLNKIITEKKKK